MAHTICCLANSSGSRKAADRAAFVFRGSRLAIFVRSSRGTVGAGRRGFAGDIGLRLVDRRIKLRDILHLNPAMRRHDNDRRRVDQSHLLPKIDIRLHLALELSGRIQHKRHLLAVLCEELLREVQQIILRGDAVLRREHLPPIVRRQFRRNLVFQIPRIQCCLVTPDVPRNQEVILHQRDLVLIRSHVHKRKRVRARRALQVLRHSKDRQLHARRGLEHRRIDEMVHLIRWHRGLGNSGAHCNERAQQGESKKAAETGRTHSVEPLEQSVALFLFNHQGSSCANPGAFSGHPSAIL